MLSVTSSIQHFLQIASTILASIVVALFPGLFENWIFQMSLGMRLPRYLPLSLGTRLPRYLPLEHHAFRDTNCHHHVMSCSPSSKVLSRPQHSLKHRELVHQHNLETSSQRPRTCFEPIPMSAWTGLVQQYGDRWTQGCSWRRGSWEPF